MLLELLLLGRLSELLLLLLLLLSKEAPDLVIGEALLSQCVDILLCLTQQHWRESGLKGNINNRSMYDSFALSLTQTQVLHQLKCPHIYRPNPTSHHQPAGRRRRIEDRISMMLMVKRCAPVKRRWSTGTTSGASEESGPRLPLCQGDQLTPYGSQRRCKQGRHPHVSKSYQCRIKDMLTKKCRY